MHIMVKDKRDGSEVLITIEQAAELMELDEGDLAWALEEFGECESEHHLAYDPLPD